MILKVTDNQYGRLFQRQLGFFSFIYGKDELTGKTRDRTTGRK